MKFLLDQFPIIAFAVAYFLPADFVQSLLALFISGEQAQSLVGYLYPQQTAQSIYLATAVAIPASLLQVIVHRVLYQRFDKAQLSTLALLVLLGGSTLALHDKRFIMWKPTAVYWLFALVFFGSKYVGDRPIIERMMGHVMTAPRNVWLLLNTCWAVFFILLGVLNLYVAKHFAEATWVKFKLLGVPGLLLVFAAAQTIYLSAHGELKEDRRD